VFTHRLFSSRSAAGGNKQLRLSALRIEQEKVGAAPEYGFTVRPQQKACAAAQAFVGAKAYPLPAGPLPKS
jgi:hypothetical protein